MSRWLASVCVLLLAGGVQAQPKPALDLRIPPVTEGTVQSIREIQTAPRNARPTTPAQPDVGLSSDLDTGPLVGSVASRQFGGPPGEKKWHLGSAGTREMQERLEQTGYEVVVKMDDGEMRTFRPRDVARLGIGQRVSVRSGELDPI